MKVFENTNEIENTFNGFVKKLDFIHKKLEDKCEQESIPILKIRDKFLLKTNDFTQKDRKLNIGIIGQIKSGRSTFLNTLIFDCEDVLPKAATPKTSTVTKIIYGENNIIEVEYYNKEEYENLKSSLGDYILSDTIDIDYYFALEKENIQCGSYECLKELLNDYIGENGKLTPIVKSVTIHIKNDKIKDICIIDTPGLNDPVLSRSKKTKEFLEMCDIVFFLSRSSHFLDKNDADLLYSQIPSKGVKKLILVCSRYDDGLNDTILDYDSLEKTDIQTKNILTNHARKVYKEVSGIFIERNVSNEVLNMLKVLEKPIFISSFAHSMSKKNMENYTNEEKNVFKNLNFHNDLTIDILKKIGDFSEIEKSLRKIITKKEETILIKSHSFIPDTKKELIVSLNNISNTFKKRINLLQNSNKAELEIQKNYMLSQTTSIRSSLEYTFLELYSILDTTKSETLEEFKLAQSKATELNEKTKTEIKEETNVVSSSKLFKPLSWGKKEVQTNTITEEYSYLDPKDALKNLKTYAEQCEDAIENNFVSSLEVENLRQKLLEVVIENYDTSLENYDPFFFKLIVSKTLDELTLPTINIDISSLLNIVSDKFSGEVRNTDARISLKILLNACITSFVKDLEYTFLNQLDIFKKQLGILKEDFFASLLDNITKEYDLILLQYNNRENEVKNYYEIMDLISGFLGDLYN